MNWRARFVAWLMTLLDVEAMDLPGDRGTGLLMRCIDHIERSMSEHNDGFRLYGEVCRYLYNLGYEGWLTRVTDPRSRYAAGLSQDPLDNADPVGQGELPPTANTVLRAAYRDLKETSKEDRLLRSRGMPLTECRADRVASDCLPLFGPIPQCHTPVEEVEPLRNSIFGEAQ